MKNQRFIGLNEDEPQFIANFDIGRIDIVGRFLCYKGTLEILHTKLTTWIINYFYNSNNKLVINFRLAYYNTAASKVFLIIFKFLEGFSKWNKQIEINWYYDEYDEDVLESGKNYSEMVALDFEFIKTTDDNKSINEIYRSWGASRQILEIEKKILPELLDYSKSKLPIKDYDDKKINHLTDYIYRNLLEIKMNLKVETEYLYFYVFHMIYTINERLLFHSNDFNKVTDLLENSFRNLEKDMPNKS